VRESKESSSRSSPFRKLRKLRIVFSNICYSGILFWICGGYPIYVIGLA